MVSRWCHWMLAGHINRRQFKQMVTQTVNGKKKRVAQAFKLGNKVRYNSAFILDTEAYQGTSMLGPRGNIIGGNVRDVIEWARTGRGGMVYDLVKASLDVDVCSSRYGLCG